MSGGRRWGIGVALVCCLATLGCASAGKPAGRPFAGLGAAGLPLLSKSEDRALREEVEKDPFPRAQGMLAAAKPKGPAAR